MINVTRLNGKEFVVNTDLIKTIEATPDTVIRLVSEDKYVVRESVDDIISRVISYRRACNAWLNNHIDRADRQREGMDES
ncbi:MAG: flagellar FlbD family protein [Peptococcaceae bacterium]|nr:flagellar FlbD family protein [Peptococcaceae bacterium]